MPVSSLDCAQVVILAKSLDTSPEMLSELARDKRHPVRECVAKNPMTPLDAFSALVVDGDHALRLAVAKNPNCPSETLYLLGKQFCADILMREFLAQHRNCPEELLAIMAKDSEPTVRTRVGENPSCPVAVLSALAGDVSVNVRTGVAKNRASPLDVLVDLACFDQFEIPRKYARKTLQAQSAADWEKATSCGPILSKPTGTGTAQTSIGDALMAIGLIDVYQNIQAAELTWQISAASGLKNRSPVLYFPDHAKSGSNRSEPKKMKL
ncbi:MULTISPECIES: hypothetical protein [Aeromonas]|uniref:hypothetical protein n=1 Tax=Aeromonas TaxID=642 RepID=UPI002B061587|nr:hypothetical protein [Aeromonas jandaei]